MELVTDFNCEVPVKLQRLKELNIEDGDKHNEDPTQMFWHHAPTMKMKQVDLAADEGFGDLLDKRIKQLDKEIADAMDMDDDY